jgi:hypothetical protein
MTKPTGRPRGRPKTSFYVMLMARVPQELADRVQRYAKLRQQPISVVLRDSLELLLEEDRYRPFLSDNNGAGDITSDMHLVDRNDILPDQDGILSDRNESELDELLSNATPGEVDTLLTEGDPVLDTLTAHMQTAIADMLSDTKEAQPAIASDTKAAHAENMSDTIPAFDPAKHVWGEVCKQGHVDVTTGMTLRYKNQKKECVICTKARKAKSKAKHKAQKRQAQPA